MPTKIHRGPQCDFPWIGFREINPSAIRKGRPPKQVTEHSAMVQGNGNRPQKLGGPHMRDRTR